MYVLRDSENEDDPGLVLKEDGRLETEMKIIYLDIIRAKEATVYKVQIPNGVRVFDLLMACELRFFLKETRLFYKGAEVDMDVVLESSENGTSYLVKEMEANKPQNSQDADESEADEYFLDPVENLLKAS